jgi:outer membrane protein assembly factor BamB
MPVKFVQFLAVLMVMSLGCNRLKIAGYPQDLEPLNQSFLTALVNYQRNAFTDQELVPPLVQSWKRDYLFFPENGLTAAEKIFFFGTGNGFLVAANVANGKLLGKKHLGKACNSPPTVYAGVLYQTFAEGRAGLVAYDLQKGYILWEVPENSSKSSVVASDRKVFFLNTTGQLQCYNYLTGDLIWSRQIDTQAENSPALHENMLIIAGLNGKIIAVEYTSGVVIWETIISDAILTDPVIHEGCVYLVTYRGDLYILDLKNGATLHSLAFHTPFYCTPVIDQTMVFLPLSNGNLQALDNHSLEVNWEFQADGPWAAAPLVTMNYVYAANLDEKLYILEKKSGRLLQEIKLNGRARSTPVIIDNKLILTCENTTVIAYGQEHNNN